MSIFTRLAALAEDMRLRALSKRGKPLPVSIGGVTYHLNPEPAAAYHARNSMTKLERMVATLDSADCIFDVGANCGIFSALCARRFPDAQVHAFEPSQQLQPILAMNCTAPNIEIHPAAVGERDETVKLYVNPHSQQTNSLQLAAVEPFASAASLEEHDVQCVTLDSFAASCGISAVDVLKIDVQGLEGAVVRGARTIMSSVRYLFLETSWLDMEGMRQALPAAEHFGFGHVAVINSVYAGADLLFTREPLQARIPNVPLHVLGAESAGTPWF